MALEMNVNTEFGIVANYIHIGAIMMEYPSKMCQVTLLVYATKETRDAGAKPMGSMLVSLANDEFPGDVDRAKIYEILKNRSEFADAKDI